MGIKTAVVLMFVVLLMIGGIGAWISWVAAEAERQCALRRERES